MAQIYIAKHWGTKESMPALIGYIKLERGKDDIISFFEEKENMKLKDQKTEYSDAVDLYSNDKLVGSFRREMHTDYQVIYYRSLSIN